MNIYCFDIEADDNRRMLELAIVDVATRQVLYHSYFKPEGDFKCESSFAIHHITEEMLKDAPYLADERTKIEALLAEADYLIGWAVKNDFDYLRDNDIIVSSETKSFDVANWFLHFEHKNFGLSYNDPALEHSAHLVGVEFDGSQAHSADYDTLATVDMFNYLIDTHIGKPLTRETIEKINEQYDYIKARDNSQGYIVLIKVDSLYLIRNYADLSSLEKYLAGAENSEAIIVEVEARFSAYDDIINQFNSKRVSGKCYNLSQGDINWFKEYKIEFDAVRERLCRLKYNHSKQKTARSARPSTTGHSLADMVKIKIDRR